MNYSDFKFLINSDLNAINNGQGILKNLLFNESFSFTFWFRVGTWLSNGSHTLTSFLFSIFYRRKMRKTTRQIPLGTQIGGIQVNTFWHSCNPSMCYHRQKLHNSSQCNNW